MEKKKEIRRPEWSSAAAFEVETAHELPIRCLFEAICYVGDQIGRLAEAADGLGIKVWHENNPQNR